MTKKKKCYFEISASFYLLSWSFPKICLSVCQKLRIFACERKNQRWKDMELMLIRKSGSENRPLTHLLFIMFSILLLNQENLQERGGRFNRSGDWSLIDLTKIGLQVIIL